MKHKRIIRIVIVLSILSLYIIYEKFKDYFPEIINNLLIFLISFGVIGTVILNANRDDKFSSQFYTKISWLISIYFSASVFASCITLVLFNEGISKFNLINLKISFALYAIYFVIKVIRKT
jgi:nitrogen fixation/metabolism regulation signal transduction histidine kinase